MISVITPSVRPEGLKMVARCLKRQDFTDWEWIVVAPECMLTSIEKNLVNYPHPILIAEPPKREGDFYNLNKAWNKAYSKAKGDLIINIVDMIWFPPDTLTRFWNHYQANPKALITAIGHQYEKEVEGKPETLIWSDPRARTDFGTFYEVEPSEMEMCLCSIPRQAILDCGGLDEEYDKGAAIGEKEMCWRLDQMGYKFYIEQSIEYRALYHPRLSKDWDKYYKVSSKIFIEHMKQINEGTRQLNVESLD
jgi:glycosyltransferase involved in cell wall biosynthesis